MIITHAEYTMVLKTIMQDIPNGSELLNKALSTYPLYESTSKEEFIPVYIPTRDELNRKLLNHYKYREIGFETVGRFLDELQIAMEEIMPYYNQLFFSADQDFNVIYNVDYKKTIDTDRDGTSQTDAETDTTAQDSSESTTHGNAHAKTVKADTPQGELALAATEIEIVPYASEAVWDNHRNTENAETSGSSSANEESTSKTVDSMKEAIVETTKGNFGAVSAQDLVLKYRETILNIEQMIINDARIQELFMLVF